MARFGVYEGEQWFPEDRDINWRLNYERLEGAGAIEPHKPVGFDSEDGLVTEVHQDNCSIFYNRQAPYMDMIAVHDPRDKKEYTWFREDNPEGFEMLVRTIGHSALLQTTRFPIEAVERVYLDRRSSDVVHLDTEEQ